MMKFKLRREVGTRKGMMDGENFLGSINLKKI